MAIFAQLLRMWADGIDTFMMDLFDGIFGIVILLLVGLFVLRFILPVIWKVLVLSVGVLEVLYDEITGAGSRRRAGDVSVAEVDTADTIEEIDPIRKLEEPPGGWPLLERPLHVGIGGPALEHLLQQFRHSKKRIWVADMYGDPRDSKPHEIYEFDIRFEPQVWWRTPGSVSARTTYRHLFGRPQIGEVSFWAQQWRSNPLEWLGTMRTVIEELGTPSSAWRDKGKRGWRWRSDETIVDVMIFTGWSGNDSVLHFTETHASFVAEPPEGKLCPWRDLEAPLLAAGVVAGRPTKEVEADLREAGYSVTDMTTHLLVADFESMGARGDLTLTREPGGLIERLEWRPTVSLNPRSDIRLDDTIRKLLGPELVATVDGDRTTVRWIELGFERRAVMVKRGPADEVWHYVEEMATDFCV